MKKAILAKKVGMTQMFMEDGTVIPVTVLSAGPCTVTQVKSDETDGYSAVQVGYDDTKEKLRADGNVYHRHGANKPHVGQFKKSELPVQKYLREFRFENSADYKVGDQIKADIFEEGDRVDITGVSRGKGFQGAIKRFNQHRGPMGHGSKFHRHQGSNGSSSDPSRVYKGKGMAGHMGSVQVTVQNLKVVRVDAEKNLILVRGSIPGAEKSLVTIKETVIAEA
ncbi:MAG: 50S ribosomal protein L3 [Lachnospiraceae bacterium]|nr:50S ribosomal protein L3 [Lachnospiraceae bacterium]